MKKEKPTLSQQGKAERLSLDAYMEDAQLINHVQTTQELDSRKEALHVICNQFRGMPEETETQKCQHLCGEYCSKNSNEGKIKKVNADYCRACQNEQKLSDREIEERRASLGEYIRLSLLHQDFFERLGVDVYKYHLEDLWFKQADVILAQLDAQFSELRQPLAEIAKLKAELEKTIPLEIDNAFLRQQLNTLKKEPLAEKCAWQTIELNNKKEEIRKLKAEIEQQESTIKAYMFQRHTSEKI